MMWPEAGATKAPGGAPGSNVQVNVSAGKSGSVAAGVKLKSAPCVTVCVGIGVMTGGALPGLVAAVWARPVRYPLKASLLCAGSATVSLYVLAYDLSILTIAAAFLVSDGLANGFLPGERVALSLCWAGQLLLPMTPIGAIISVALLLLIGRRITTAHSAAATPLFAPAE